MVAVVVVCERVYSVCVVVCVRVYGVRVCCGVCVFKSTQTVLQGCCLNEVWSIVITCDTWGE